MQRVLCIGLCSHFSCVLVLFTRQILFDVVLFLEALLQIMRCWILILHQLLLILIELQDVAIEHLDFVEWSALDLNQILHQLVIIQLEVAQVAHTKLLWVFLGKLAFLITAHDTNRPGAFLAVSDWIPVEPDSAGEGSLTKHAVRNFLPLLMDCFTVPSIRQISYVDGICHWSSTVASVRLCSHLILRIWEWILSKNLGS